MEYLSERKLFQTWLKNELRYISIFVVFGLIAFITIGLYGKSIEPVLYTLLMCMFVGICFLIVNYYHYRQRYHAIYEAYLNLEFSLDNLPKSQDLIEESYQQIAKDLFESRNIVSTEMKNQILENTDYYTLWVHQIKTPISAIQMLLQSEVDTENIRLMKQETFKIEQYAKMALYYVRLYSIGSDLLLKEYNLYDITKQAVKKYAIGFIEKKLVLSFEPFSGRVITDEKWLGFIIEQILSNCVKYTQLGQIGIFYENTKGSTLIISDTGIGIKEEDLPRIFEKGFTGYNGRMDKKSTGIGLYLCKKVADHLGITIKVTSELGKGTTFSLEFPKENPNLTKMKD